MKIQATKIGLTINSREILNHVDVDIPEKCLHALVGPSGSGKSSLLNCLALLQPISSGSLLLGDADLSKATDKVRQKWWRKSISFIFQDFGLIEDESVGYNVALSRLGIWGGVRQHSAEVKRCLAHVGLEDRFSSIVATLSGGEKQRVGFARALFKESALVFADEPTASLDRNNRTLITDALHSLAQQGATVVVATHDEELINTADSITRLTPGGNEKNEAPLT